MKSINFNQSIYVKLTDKIIQKHVSEQNQYWIQIYLVNTAIDIKRLLTSVEEFKKKEENGFYEFQIWDFIDKFGKYFGNGNIPLQDGNLYFKEEDLQQV